MFSITHPCFTNPETNMYVETIKIEGLPSGEFTSVPIQTASASNKFTLEEFEPA